MGEDTCTTDGCGKRRAARSLCKTHYNLWHRANANTGRTCSVEGCAGKHYGRGWCAKHYSRWRKTGTVQIRPPRTCMVDGCDARHFSRGWCAKHYNRWRKHGDPLRVDRGGFAHPKGEANPVWVGDRASYGTIHNRLRKMRGTPSRCDHCGTTGTAAIYQWALDWDRVSEVKHWPKRRRGRVEMLPYSTKVEDYIRLCLPCHRAFDLRHASTGT